MKFPKPILFPLISVLAISVSGLAQKAQPSKPQTVRDDPAQKLGVLEVRLPVSVTEKNKFVPGLTVRNFEVFEDGKPQNIINFVAPSELPLRVGLLVDTSNSVKLKLPFEKDAGEDFVADVITRRKKDQVLLGSFDSDVELHVDFTDNQEALIRELRKLKASGVTRLYDAIYRIIEEKMANQTGDDSRRIIVVLSDGEDTASEKTLKEALEMAQKYDVTIFGISTKNFKGVGAGMVEGEDDKELRQLCEGTGGQVFLPTEKEELFRSFSRIATDLRHEYVLFYKPTNQERSIKRREIKVKLIGADGHLYFKRGYVY